MRSFTKKVAVLMLTTSMGLATNLKPLDIADVSVVQNGKVLLSKKNIINIDEYTSALDADGSLRANLLKSMVDSDAVNADGEIDGNKLDAGNIGHLLMYVLDGNVKLNTKAPAVLGMFETIKIWHGKVVQELINMSKSKKKPKGAVVQPSVNPGKGSLIDEAPLIEILVNKVIPALSKFGEDVDSDKLATDKLPADVAGILNVFADQLGILHENYKILVNNVTKQHNMLLEGKVKQLADPLNPPKPKGPKYVTNPKALTYNDMLEVYGAAKSFKEKMTQTRDGVSLENWRNAAIDKKLDSDGKVSK